MFKWTFGRLAWQDLPVCLMGGAAILGDLGTHLLPAQAAAPKCPADMVETGVKTCIDRHEWARPDGRPLLGVSGLPEPDADVDLSLDTLCHSVGKRVCEREEWASACSHGEPYPYGGKYEPGRCNDEKWWKTVDEAKVAHRDPKELERLDGSEPAGSRPGCQSPSGAVDMVGNAEEWVRCREGKFGWCLVGGYWASRGSRTCESAILTHAPRWHYYQSSGRCCMAQVNP
jgi:hypothetical protein